MRTGQSLFGCSGRANTLSMPHHIGSDLTLASHGGQLAERLRLRRAAGACSSAPASDGCGCDDLLGGGVGRRAAAERPGGGRATCPRAAGAGGACPAAVVAEPRDGVVVVLLVVKVTILSKSKSTL